MWIVIAVIAVSAGGSVWLQWRELLKQLPDHAEHLVLF